MLEMPEFGYNKCYSIIFLSWTLYLIGVWVGEDQRTNTKKTHARKSLDYALKFD